MSINKVIITGNLTREPELRYTNTQTAVLDIGVAVNDHRKNKESGQWESVPNYFDCYIFGTRAEALNRYLHTGTKVAIEGRLHWRQWENDGEKRSKIEIHVNELEFLEQKQQGRIETTVEQPQVVQPQGVPQFNSQQQNYQAVNQAVKNAQPVDSLADEEIPF